MPNRKVVPIRGPDDFEAAINRLMDEYKAGRMEAIGLAYELPTETADEKLTMTWWDGNSTRVLGLCQRLAHRVNLRVDAANDLD